MMLLKLMSGRNWSVWAVSVWLRIGTSAGFWEDGIESSDATRHGEFDG
jgi:hypothetical protein